MIESLSPSSKIKQIENSLRSLSNQVKILGRAQNYSIKSLEKCFEQCVPLIKSKIEESQQHFKIKRMHQQTQQEKENRIMGIKMKKYDEIKKKSNVRALISSIKHKQATEIREQSVKHMQLMKQQKIKQHEQKIRNSERIKSEQSLIQQKIKSFHSEKREDLSRLKKKEEDEKQSRIEKSNKLIDKINKQKITSQYRFNQTHNSLNNLRSTLRRIKFMRPQEFSDIINNTFNDELNSSNSNPKLNETVLIEMNGFNSPIFGPQSRFTSGEQFIASKILNKLMEGPHRADRSF